MFNVSRGQSKGAANWIRTRSGELGRLGSVDEGVLPKDARGEREKRRENFRVKLTF